MNVEADIEGVIKNKVGNEKVATEGENLQDLRDGVDHVESHFHGAATMVTTRLRQARDAIVAVAQDLNAQAVVILGKNEE